MRIYEIDIDNHQLLESSHINFPPPNIVFSDEEVKSILRVGFDIGVGYGESAPANRNSGDMHSLDVFFEEEYDDESGYSETEFLTNWLRGPRYNHIKNMIQNNALIQNGFIGIFRSIKVSPEKVAAIAAGKGGHLGEFWSYKRNDPHWAPESDNLLLLELQANVKISDVDWITSFRRMANYVYGDDEGEISLSRGTPLHLHRMIIAPNDDVEVTKWDQIA